METDEDLDRDIEAGARFALRIRLAIQNPERWADIIKSARSLMAVVSTTPIPPKMDDITLLALAYVASIRCAKEVLADDGDAQKAVDGLKRIAGVA
jgi:hypothetical protein